MLVLSRRQNQGLNFPNLGIRISVLRTAGKIVKLGIDAPKEIRVARDELDPLAEPDSSVGHVPKAESMSKEQRHLFRDRLNAATLGLQVLQQRLESGNAEDCETLIYRIFNNLQDLNSQLDAQRVSVEEKTEKPNPLVLIVEDNANEGQLLSEFLQMSGYDTDIVANGLEAVEYLQENEPDIVLMDMNMPEMDGPETIRSIRSEPGLAELPLYGVSGLNNDEAGVPIGEEGVNRWFTKPVDARLLVEQISDELSDERVSA